LVMENGRLTQQGKHDKLIRKSRLYKEMWEKQKRYQNRDKQDIF
jgi:ABC-type multidrug transport system fused ATPase/permease subunit